MNSLEWIYPGYVDLSIAGGTPEVVLELKKYQASCHSSTSDLSVAKVAEMLGVSVHTVYKQLRSYLETDGQDGLRGYKVGKLWRVPKDALIDYPGRLLKRNELPKSHLPGSKKSSNDDSANPTNPLVDYVRGKGGEVTTDLATIMRDLRIDGKTLHRWITELTDARRLSQTGFRWKLVDYSGT